MTERLLTKRSPRRAACAALWRAAGRSCRTRWALVGGAAEPGGPWWRSRRAGWAPAAHSVGAERGAWHGALLPAPPVVALSSKVADVQHVNSRRVCGPSLRHRECVAEECLGLCVKVGFSCVMPRGKRSWCRPLICSTGHRKRWVGCWVGVVSASRGVHAWTRSGCLTARWVCGNSAHQQGAPGVVTQSHADWNQIQRSDRVK